MVRGRRGDRPPLDVVLAQGVAPSTTALATVGLIGVAGLLLVAGGLDLLGETVPWYRLVGIDWFDGGEFFDLSNYEPGPIFASAGGGGSGESDADSPEEPSG